MMLSLLSSTISRSSSLYSLRTLSSHALRSSSYAASTQQLVTLNRDCDGSLTPPKDYDTRHDVVDFTPWPLSILPNYFGSTIAITTYHQEQQQQQLTTTPFPSIIRGVIDTRSISLQSLFDLSTWLIKRTFQPSIIRKRRKHGFLRRQESVGGRKVLKRRKLKGRMRLGGS